MAIPALAANAFSDPCAPCGGDVAFSARAVYCWNSQVGWIFEWRLEFVPAGDPDGVSHWLLSRQLCEAATSHKLS